MALDGQFVFENKQVLAAMLSNGNAALLIGGSILLSSSVLIVLNYI